ncbi:response regulator [Methanobacterium sp.]|uniref:response regulator n=1 Tax=Methanobacterium sp. TaxID=2164 RepID=UPI003C754E01
MTGNRNSQDIASISILLVEDNLADARLIEEFLKEINMKAVLHIVRDGKEAMEFLYLNCKYNGKYQSTFVILDLNLPKMGGREVLKEIKCDDELKRIPVVILTTSTAEEDIIECYNNHANCYITKPLDFDEFANTMDLIKSFWFNIAELPKN